MPAFDAGTTAISWPVSTDYRISALQGTFQNGAPQVWLSQQLTYSFPSGPSYFDQGLNYGTGEISAGWIPMSSLQQAAVRKALDAWSAVANISFTQVADSTTVGDFRFAFTSSITGTTLGHAYSPASNSASASDVWVRSSLANQTFGANAQASLYSRDQAQNFEILVHEIGHALGLSHPFAKTGETRGTAVLPATEDSFKNTVMSYGDDGYGHYAIPTTPMPYDILAIQYMYGANYAYNAGNSTYAIDVDNVNFLTLWDGGGNDTLSATNVRNVNQSQSGGARIDLREGAGSSIGFASQDFAQVSQLSGNAVVYPWRNNGGANVFIAYGCVIENAIGSSGNDTITGNASNNVLTGGLGFDSIDGGAGRDTAVLDAARSSYSVTKTATGFAVGRSAGSVSDSKTLTNVERLQFSDTKVALDVSGNAGTTAKVLGAVFGRTLATNKEYMGIGLGLLDGGMSYVSLMQAALNAKLGVGASNTAVVNLLYTNLTGVAPSASELALYKGMLDSGTIAPANLGVIAAEHTLNQTNINLVGLANTGIEYQ